MEVIRIWSLYPDIDSRSRPYSPWQTYPVSDCSCVQYFAVLSLHGYPVRGSRVIWIRPIAHSVSWPDAVEDTKPGFSSFMFVLVQVFLCLFFSVFLVHMLFCFSVFRWQYECNWLPAKARLWNDEDGKLDLLNSVHEQPKLKGLIREHWAVWTLDADSDEAVLVFSQWCENTELDYSY